MNTPKYKKEVDKNVINFKVYGPYTDRKDLSLKNIINNINIYRDSYYKKHKTNIKDEDIHIINSNSSLILTHTIITVESDSAFEKRVAKLEKQRLDRLKKKEERAAAKKLKEEQAKAKKDAEEYKLYLALQEKFKGPSLV